MKNSADIEMARVILSKLLCQEIEEGHPRWESSVTAARAVSLPPEEVRTCHFLHMESLNDEYGDDWRDWRELEPALIAEVGGERLVLEGTHRAHQAVHDGRALSAMLISLDWAHDDLLVAIGRLHTY